MTNMDLEQIAEQISKAQADLVLIATDLKGLQIELLKHIDREKRRQWAKKLP